MEWIKMWTLCQCQTNEIFQFFTQPKQLSADRRTGGWEYSLVLLFDCNCVELSTWVINPGCKNKNLKVQFLYMKLMFNLFMRPFILWQQKQLQSVLSKSYICRQITPYNIKRQFSAAFSHTHTHTISFKRKNSRTEPKNR